MALLEWGGEPSEVIIGSEPAGYTAALYASRENLDVLLFQGSESGGQIMLVPEVKNEGSRGTRIVDEFKEQVARILKFCDPCADKCLAGILMVWARQSVR